ncbi:MAG: hypothetical protein CM15mP62_28690 [Rhodospirillaceae bacterium]|nr:MAG: hypothetical protein CM15mP62_28690 [Rhodospirillaceae bacterium]
MRHMRRTLKSVELPKVWRILLAFNSPIHYYGLSLENTSARYLEMAVPKGKQLHPRGICDAHMMQ